MYEYMNGHLSLKPSYMNGSLIHKPSKRQAGLVLEGSSDPAEHYAYHTLLSNRPTKSEGYSFWRHPCVRPFRLNVLKKVGYSMDISCDSRQEWL